MKSTNTAQLYLPFLLPEACKVHIFPCLALGSLISIGQLCDYGCTATFTTTTVVVSLGENQVCSGTRSHATQNLWCLDTVQSSQAPVTPIGNINGIASNNAANSMVPTTTSRERVAFVHVSCFSPSPSTLIAAIDAGRMTGFPWLTSERIRRHLPLSTAMVKGHLDQQQENLRSTQPKPALEMPTKDSPETLPPISA